MQPARKGVILFPEEGDVVGVAGFSPTAEDDNEESYDEEKEEGAEDGTIDQGGICCGGEG